MLTPRFRLGQDNFTLEAREVLTSIVPSFSSFVLAATEAKIDAEATSSGQVLVLNNPSQFPSSKTIDNLTLQRFFSSGKLDNTYGNGGILNLTPLLKSAWGIPQDGQEVGVVISGRPMNAPTSELIVGPEGKWYLAVSTSFNVIKDPVLPPTEPEGGYTLTPTWYANAGQYKNAIVRFNSDGTLDDSYGQNGIAVRETDLDFATWKVTDIKFGPDGSAYLQTFFETEVTYSIPNQQPFETKVSSMIQKLLPNGSPDLSFGEQSYLQAVGEITDFGYGRRSADLLHVFDDGSMLLGGSREVKIGIDPKSQQSLTKSVPYTFKVNVQGQLDTSYGNQGHGEFPAEFSRDFSNVTLTALKDGTVLARASVSKLVLDSTNTSDQIVTKLFPNGQLDTNFGTNGIVSINSPYFEYSNLQFFADPKGDYLVVGSTGGRIVIQKLTTRGATDTTFGQGGFTVLQGPIRYTSGPITDQPRGVGPDGRYTDFSLDDQGRLMASGVQVNLMGKTTSAVLTQIDLNVPTRVLPPLPPDLGGRRSFGRTPLHPPMGDPAQEGGSPSRIRYEHKGEAKEFQPYESSYAGGLITLSEDLDGDGVQEIVVSPDVGGSSRIQVYKMVEGELQLMANFFGIEDPGFRGGSRIALSDLNEDGKLDLIVSAGPGGGPRIAIYDGTTLVPGTTPRKLMSDFFAYVGDDNNQLTNGVSIAAHDFDNDKVRDLFIGAGPGGGPRLTVLSGKTLFQEGADQARRNPLDDRFIGDPNDRQGVFVYAESFAAFATNRLTGEQERFYRLGVD
ncbi:MAG: FG-GAP repeat domain-containing protein [Fimbriiglobus sp.]